ncbi:hypothetical protein V8C40DRAFT_283122 [Trichoderma camerunense]
MAQKTEPLAPYHLPEENRSVRTPPEMNRTEQLTYWLGEDRIVNNTVNSAHVTLARRGYEIQQIMGIPNQYGMFSSGPARLQAYEGYLVAYLAFLLLFLTIVVAAILMLRYLVESREFSIPRLILAYLMFAIPLIAIAWLMVVFGRRRSPDYVWAEGRKLHTV